MRMTRSGLALAAAVAMLGVGGPAIESYSGPPRPVRKLPRGYANDMNRKQSRAADRSKKQFLIKGVRP